MRNLLTTKGVADYIGQSYDLFLRKKEGLIANHGFPPPVPGLGFTWDKKAIDLWFDQKIPEDLRDQGSGGGDQPANVVNIQDELDRRLNERAERLARGLEPDPGSEARGEDPPLGGDAA